MSESWQKLIEILLERHLAKRRTLEDAIRRYRATGDTVEKVLVESGIVSKSQLLSLKAEIHKLDTVDLQTVAIDNDVADYLPQAMSERYRVVCIARQGKTLVLASAEPLDAIASDYVRMRSGFEIKQLLTYAGDLDDARRKIYGKAPSGRGNEGRMNEVLRGNVTQDTSPLAQGVRVVTLDGSGQDTAALTLPGGRLTPVEETRRDRKVVAPASAPKKPLTPEPPADFKPVWKIAKEPRHERSDPLSGLKAAVSGPHRVVKMSVPASVCTLCASTLQLHKNLDENLLLNRLMESGMEAVRAEALSLLLLEADGCNLFFKHAVGASAKNIVNMVVPLDEESVAGWVVTHNQPMLVANAQTDPRHNKQTDKMLGFSTRDVIAVPITWDTQVLGVLEAVNRKSDGYTVEDTAQLEIVAAQLAVVLNHGRMVAQLNTLLMETIDVLVEMLQAQGKSTRRHLIAVTQLATALGREAGLPQTDLESLCYAGLLHDIGMAGLTVGEEPQHTARGADLLSRIPMLSRVVPYVRFHHERWDGKGPYGVAGNNIPQGARVLAVAVDWCENKPVNVGDLNQYTEYFMARFGTAFDPSLQAPFVRALTTTSQGE